VSNAQILVVLGVCVFVILGLGGLLLIVLARLRRVIKSQLEALEQVARAVSASQDHDKPSEPS
jgi:hypothetical protein